jgi:hypothetical protein
MQESKPQLKKETWKERLLIHWMGFRVLVYAARMTILVVIAAALAGINCFSFFRGKGDTTSVAVAAAFFLAFSCFRFLRRGVEPATHFAFGCFLILNDCARINPTLYRLYLWSSR